MSKQFLPLLFLLFGGLSSLKGQFCLPQGITFSTQAEIDQFALDYPDCKQIMGIVTISGPDITNLNGLSGITSFGKGLYIQNNPNLGSLEGLDQVHTIGAGGVLGSLYVTNNPLLSDLSGLDNLSYILDRLDISENEGLDSLHGLDKLQTVGSTFYLQNNGLFKDLRGLGSLETVGDDLYIEFCDSLLSLKGIEKLNRVGRSLYIQFNPVLHDIFSISPEFEVGDYWVFSLNDSLNQCGIEALCRVVEATPEMILQCANGPDCTGVADLEIQCGLVSEKTPVRPMEQRLLSPNPADAEAYIQVPVAEGWLTLFDQLGVVQKRMLLQGTRRVDLTGLSAGVYMVYWEGLDGQRRVDRLVRN
ncbi:MAG: T9SS type A sorting domain-containing protein [Saprospiraceae bacterium]|nr:T9SS type A sorting domain-containing protein [Saprospiraceae bacterium]